jgi:hypothetical protein
MMNITIFQWIIDNENFIKESHWINNILKENKYNVHLNELLETILDNSKSHIKEKYNVTDLSNYYDIIDNFAYNLYNNKFYKINKQDYVNNLNLFSDNLLYFVFDKKNNEEYYFFDVNDEELKKFSHINIKLITEKPTKFILAIENYI